MTIIDNLRAIRARMTKATNSVADDIQSLRAQITAKRAELKSLASAPAPRGEIEQRIRDLVKRTGDAWLAREGQSIVSIRLGSPVRSASVPWVEKSDAMPWAVLCAADPDLAVKLLVNLAARVEYAPGLALADRPAVIEKLEADIADLEEGEERLVDEAAEVGLVIAHRPEVVQRRETEARNAQLEAEKIANRSARQVGLDQKYEKRSRLVILGSNSSRVGRSAYLS